MPKIVCICGTSRPGNYTGKALAIVKDELAKLGMIVESVDAADLSLSFPGQPATEDAKKLQEAVKEAAGVVMVTARTPEDSLYRALAGRPGVERIGDCLAPGTVATAVYSGHQYARELDAGPPADVRFRRERPVVP